MRRQILVDVCLLALLAAALIWPLFTIQYLNDWMSIEGTFISDARYIQDHFPHPKWHALWYCGARFDYIYPPLTSFGSAIISMLFGVVPAQGYHIYIALFYCLGIAGAYFMLRVWTGRRGIAWLAAVFYALLSPCHALFSEWRADSAHGMPLRLNFLTKWGEGPHLSALALLTFALGLLFIALTRRSLAALAGCAVVSAMVVSNNLYGAVTLGLLFPIAVWAIFLGRRQGSMWVRSAAIIALTYGLCAWWFTPSFVKLTARNLQLVALPGNAWSKVLAVVLAIAFLAGSWHWSRSRADRAWPVFFGGSLLLFGLIVLGSRWFGFRIAGEPHRFLPELDLLLILALAEGICLLWSVRRWLAVVAAALCLSFSAPYVRAAWKVFPVEPDYRSRIEYRLPEWFARNLPGTRIYAAGSTCFWYDTWRDMPQVAGGSAQGMQTLMPALIDWQITRGDDAARDVAWLVATGAGAIVTHESPSQEIYRVIENPRKFRGILPVIYDRDGDVIYRVPRRFPGLARVVNEARMASLSPIPWNNENREALLAYGAAAEDSPTEVGYERTGVAEMRLRVRTQPGESILVQENWDAGWHGEDRGAPLEIRTDIMGFMRLQTSPGDHDIRLVYDWPLESRIGQIITLLSLGLVFGLWLGAAAGPRLQGRIRSVLRSHSISSVFQAGMAVFFSQFPIP